MRVYLVYFLVIWLAAACSPVKVQTDVMSVSDFSDMKNFGWFETSAAPGEGARINNPELASLVREAVEKNLQEKGFVKNGKADFLVNWLGAIDKKVQTESVQHFYSGYGYGALSAKSGQATPVASYEEGTIVIDILDPQKHRVLWRGKGTRRLKKGMSEAQVVQYIDMSVEEILKNFPVNRK